MSTNTYDSSPLTQFSEDERLLQLNVRSFADAEIRPLVREMEESAQLSSTLLKQLFDLGIMGIEVPESFGGAGGNVFLSVIAIEELARVDPSVSVVVDVQNTLVINALNRWGSDDILSRFLPKLATDTIGAYALSESGSGVIIQVVLTSRCAKPRLSVKVSSEVLPRQGIWLCAVSADSIEYIQTHATILHSCCSVSKIIIFRLVYK